MRKVFVGLSGGVDSSVAAALLSRPSGASERKRAGFDVTGVFMKFWSEGLKPENSCCSLESERRARMVAQRLRIPFLVFDFRKEFKKAVVDYFLEQMRRGLTPNPCTVCNKEIKFGLFLKKALSLGADFVATGHYARIKPRSKGFSLLKARDKNKDQSYFLWQLGQRELNRTLFPVGDYTKDEVRRLAGKFALPNAKVADSQNLCFLTSDVRDFLQSRFKDNPGPIADQQGNVIGRHQGLWFYTLGQREDIGPSLFSEQQSQGPHFVLRKDWKKNVLVVTRDEKDLLGRELLVSELSWVFGQPPKLPLRVRIKLRSRQKETPALICKAKKRNQVLVRLRREERAITPGQSAVFYQKEELLGGGMISERERRSF